MYSDREFGRIGNPGSNRSHEDTSRRFGKAGLPHPMLQCAARARSPLCPLRYEYMYKVYNFHYCLYTDHRHKRTHGPYRLPLTSLKYFLSNPEIHIHVLPMQSPPPILLHGSGFASALHVYTSQLSPEQPSLHWHTPSTHLKRSSSPQSMPEHGSTVDMQYRVSF